MSYSFDPTSGPIIVRAEVTGPSRGLTVRLILDTGATTSLLDEEVLFNLGYDLVSVTDRVQMATGSLVTSVPRVVLTRLSALGKRSVGMPVLAHTLAVNMSVHGLLGLDFFRGEVLTIDFRSKRIALS